MKRVLAGCLCLSLWGADKFVSPSGSGSTYSYAVPGSLETILTTPAHAACGDTIWLLPGTYGTGGSYLISTTLTCETAGQQITIRALPSATLLYPAIVDGGIQSTGAVYNRLTFRDIRFTNSTGGTRSYNGASARSPGLFFSFSSGGREKKAVNNLIDNVGQPGIGSYSQPAAYIYGNIVLMIGAFDTDPAYNTERGSGIYSQGSMTNWDDALHIEQNLLLHNYTTCGKSYGQSVGVSYARWTANVGIASGFEPCIFLAHRNSTDLNYISMTRNRPYIQPSGLSFRLGYSNTDTTWSAGCRKGCSITDNRLISMSGTGTDGSVHMYRLVRPEFRNNVIVAPPAGSGIALTKVRITDEDDPWTGWDYNSYHRGGNVGGYIFTKRQPDGNYTSLAAWVTGSGGLDAHSTHSASLPAANEIQYDQNAYERGRGHITVMNWTNAASVNVDLGQLGYVNGEVYEIRDGQNPLTVLYTGTYDGSAVSVAIGSHTALHPLVGTLPSYTPTHTNAVFGVYLVNRKRDSVATVSAITSTSATLSYKANGGVCRMWLNGTYHGADNGLGLNRTYNLTGLTTGTAYTVVSDCMWTETFNTL